MKRILILTVAALFGLATTASASTLTVTSDFPVYYVGDDINLTITGVPTGSDQAIIGTLLYSAALTDQRLPLPSAGPQTQVTSFGGVISWVLGVLTVTDGSATVFNQIGGLNPLPADPLASLSSLRLTAMAPGVVTVDWADTLHFFGILGAMPATTFTIVAVPEPGTLLLLGAGLTGLLVQGRRRES